MAHLAIKCQVSFEKVCKVHSLTRLTGVAHVGSSLSTCHHDRHLSHPLPTGLQSLPSGQLGSLAFYCIFNVPLPKSIFVCVFSHYTFVLAYTSIIISVSFFRINSQNIKFKNKTIYNSSTIFSKNFQMSS